MNGHLKDLKCGGRPMTKNELKIKKLQQENQQLKEQLQQKEDNINKVKKLIYKQIKEIEELNLGICLKEYYDWIKILDNKGSDE